MADGEDDVEYVFQASGDACGICSGLDGSAATELPHENCQCQILTMPKGKKGKGKHGSNYFYGEGISNHYGSGELDYTIGTEIQVECCDGTLIGESLPIDGHDLPEQMDPAFFDAYFEALGQAAAELADGCDECEDEDPPLVS